MRGSGSRRGGQIDQRDRGRKRHRDLMDRTSGGGSVSARSEDGIEHWFDDFLRAVSAESAHGDAAAFRSFSIKRFLQESAMFHQSPDERLRLLAIHIEEAVRGVEAYDLWLAADRLYREATRLDPNDAVHFCSHALTAYYLAERIDDDRSVKLRDVAMGRSALAASIDRSSVHAFTVAGQCHYEAAPEVALAFYRQAVELDPEAAFASLYFAHCLHDLQRWDEAIAAYRRVPLEKFVGRHAWRVDLLAEQVADCLRQAGRLDEGRDAVVAIVERYEKQPTLGRQSGMQLLFDAGQQWPDLVPRLEAIRDGVS